MARRPGRVIGVGQLVLGISHRMISSGALRRALPLLALVSALLGTWLQAPPAAIAGVGAWNADVPAVDTVDGADRTAVTPKPAQLRSATKKRFETQGGPPVEPILKTVDRLDQANCDRRLVALHESVHLAKPAATVAQPRAPPSSRT